MKIVVLALLLSSFALANSFDYAKAYFQGGIEAIEQLVEDEFTKEEFWVEALANENVKFGYFQNKKYDHIVVVDKMAKKLSLFDANYNKIISIPVQVGKEMGDKMVEGDLKTPLGVYNFIRRIQHLDPDYGPLAITTNYPNFYDRTHGKTGHGIWIHGLPENNPFKVATEGCIAMENDLLLQFDALINHKKALLITNEQGLMTTDIQEIAKILAFIHRWKIAWKYDDFENYIDAYDEDFKWHNGMDKERFTRHKSHIFKIASNKQIIHSDFEIIPYPTELYTQRIFQVKMHQDYSASNHKSQGEKILFIKMDGDEPKIILEK